MSDELKAYDIKHAKRPKRRNLIIDSDSDSSDTASVTAVDSVENGGGTASKNQSMGSQKRSRESDSDASISAPEHKRLKQMQNKNETDRNGLNKKRTAFQKNEDQARFVNFTKTRILNEVEDIIEIESTSDVMNEKGRYHLYYRHI